ncbi:MAG: gfo/Idh/MocA family oxidoreductase, partial [Vallitaleaceae bacterium]|nr:gfo/Idh/MocA family oxidoreductase [Vallitaleaceae bacterium]
MRIGQKQVYGKVKIVESAFGFKMGDPTQWRLKKALSGGGAMMDVGIYAIQAARISTGEEPLYVTAQEFKTDKIKFNEVDETILWQMEFPSGAVSNSLTTYA